MRRLASRVASVLMMSSLVLMLGAAAAHAAGNNPPGNNGTVKVDGTDIDSIPENAPHQGCVFVLEFRGYDEGANLNATYSLETQPPTGHGDVLVSGTTFIGEDPAGGANDLDSTVTIDLNTVDLSAFIPQPQQGFHLKLTVHADGSIGQDTKYKVFWVTGCPTYPLQPTQNVQDLPANLQTESPKPPSGIAWPIVVAGAFLALAAIVVARRRAAAAAKR